MSKKTIYILISILVLSGIITGGYFIYKNQNKKTNIEVEEGEYKKISPYRTSINKEEEKKVIKVINNCENIEPEFETIPSIRYVNRTDGYIYNINTKNKQKERISD